MGVLDDAIREHLELKRRHGAPDEEVEQLQSEVFGAEAQASVSEAQVDSASLEERPEETAAEFGDVSEASGGVEEPARGEYVDVEVDDREERRDDVRDDVEVEHEDERDDEERDEHEDDERDEYDDGRDEDDEDDGDHEEDQRDDDEIRDDVRSDLTQEYDVEADFDLEGGETSDTQHVRHEDRDDEAGAQDESYEDDDEDDDWDTGSHEPAPEARGAPQRSDEDEHEDDDDEGVLEEVPDFLQDTPEHDRLWFEQAPPKDFDFDD